MGRAGEGFRGIWCLAAHKGTPKFPGILPRAKCSYSNTAAKEITPEPLRVFARPRGGLPGEYPPGKNPSMDFFQPWRSQGKGKQQSQREKSDAGLAQNGAREIRPRASRKRRSAVGQRPSPKGPPRNSGGAASAQPKGARTIETTTLHE